MADVPIISLDPYLASVQALLFALQEAGLIPDLNPLDYIISAFDGKPKLEDTELAALRLQTSPWWPLKALGTNLQIWVRNGVPLSTGIAADRAQLSEWIRGTIDSLEPIVYGRLDPYSLDHAIWLSMTSEQGDSAIVQLNNTIAEQHALGPLPALPSTTPQPPPGVVPGTGPNDIQVSTDGDELNDIGQTVIFQNSLIYDALVNLGNALSKPGDDKCCINVVQSISNVVGQLSIIAAALSSSNSTQVNIDFTPLTAELVALVGAVSAYPPAVNACCAALNASLGGIRDAIASAPGTDTSAIVEQLKALVTQGDVKQSVIDYLVAQGYVDGSTAQVISGAPWAETIVGFFRTAGWQALQWALKFCGLTINGGVLTLQPHDSTIAHYLEVFIRDALAAGAAPLYPVVKGLLDSIVALLTPAGVPSIGDVGVDENVLISETVSPSLILRGVLLVLSFFDIGGGELLEGYVDLFSELTGLQEIRELQVGQRMKWGPMREAELRAKGTYRQEMAGLGTMASWVARGLYSEARYNGLAPLTGAPPEQVQPALDAAYSGLGARRILPLLATGLFSQADIADELTFSGLRPASMKRYLLAAPYLATNTERNALRSSLEKAYIAGLLSTPDLRARIDSAQQNTDRDSLVLERSDLEKLIVATKDLETEYTTMYTGGLIDDAAYRSFLAGIGLQPDMVNFIAGKAEARANATLHRKELAAAAALQRATATVERQTALKNYEDGITPLPVYTAALIATGLTPVQAAAWGDLAVLKKSGNLRWVYGLQLSPSEATILKQRITALTDQRKRQIITQQNYVQSLGQLGISPTWINALDAAAEATLTPKLSAFGVPVQTS